MKQLVCEMCGSTDLIKDGGVFVCQSCGCKYSVEEAKRMMVEGVVEVTGTVSVDNSAQIENFIHIAHNALEANNHKEADEYANKILEIDRQNAEAWLIKGEAVGWQSNLNMVRLEEATSNWLTALSCANGDEIERISSNIVSVSSSLFFSYISAKADFFAKYPDEDELLHVAQALELCLDCMNRLSIDGGVRFNRSYLYQEIAKTLNRAAANSFLASVKTFKKNKTTANLLRMVNSGDEIGRLLNVLALRYARTDDMCRTIYDNQIAICEEAIEARTDDYNTLDTAGKNARRESIKELKQKKAALKPSKQELTLSSARGDAEKKERELAVRQYWDTHASEKQELESEKSSLNERLKQIESQMSSLPETHAIEEQKKAISDLKKRLDSLGIFKGKEKAALQEKIALEQKKIPGLQEAEKVRIQQLQDEKEPILSRKKEIDAEFKKDRGRVPLESRIIQAIPDALKDGTIAVSPSSLAESLNKTLPEGYSAAFDKQFGNPGYRPAGALASTIKIMKPQSRDNKNADVQVYCWSTSASAQTIQAITMEMEAKVLAETDLTDWVIVGSRIMCLLDSSVSLDATEQLIFEDIYGERSSLGMTQNLEVEYVSTERDGKMLAMALSLGVPSNISYGLRDVMRVAIITAAKHEHDVLSPAEETVDAAEQLCDLMLLSYNDSKISVIKAIREQIGFGLAETKELVESSPVAIKTGLPLSEAKLMKHHLEEAGATVEIVVLS